MIEPHQTFWLIPVDTELSEYHSTSGEDRKTLGPRLLAARIRQNGVDRMAAFLYGHGIGESIEEAFTLLMQYLTLLDAGERPIALAQALDDLQAKINEQEPS